MAIRKFIIYTIATFFYIGYLPFVPGTFGSLAGLFVFYLVKGNSYLYGLTACILIILGFLFAGKAEKMMQKKDARCIVIDEVSGMLLSLIFIPYNIKLVIIAFFIFRLLDTFKPYPACALENLKGSIGIMADDIVAGIYTNIILQIVFRLASFKIS